MLQSQLQATLVWEGKLQVTLDDPVYPATILIQDSKRKHLPKSLWSLCKASDWFIDEVSDRCICKLWRLNRKLRTHKTVFGRNAFF